MNALNITWEKCHHGVEKRSPYPCEQCRKEKDNYLLRAVKPNDEPRTRIPILRGCKNKICFCDGSCQDIIGYRDPIYNGE